jgi:GNAT superfamily N-acetyltransferase
MACRSPEPPPRIVSRPLQGDEDWWRLRRLLVEIAPLAPPGYCWDVRRLDGSRFYHADPPRNPRWQTLTRLWETVEGRLVAAVNQEGRGDAHLQVHPDFRHLEEWMVAWAEENLAAPGEEENRRELELVVFDHDERRRELLERRGYRKTSDWGVTRRLRLGDPPPSPPSAAAGYVLRKTRPDELRDRERIADLLNAAFGRTFHTAGEYGAFTRMAPSFAADLDLVAVAPDGCFAAYVGIAYDDANGRGIVEPVCTHPDHRRNGLARALILEGLTRLEARGAVEATVETGSREAANALYAGLELTGAYRSSTWRTII